MLFLLSAFFMTSCYDVRDIYLDEFACNKWTATHGDTIVNAVFRDNGECCIRYTLSNDRNITEVKGYYTTYTGILKYQDFTITDKDTCYSFEHAIMHRGFSHIVITGKKILLSNDSILEYWNEKFYNTSLPPLNR